MSETVTTGNERVGTLSLSGNTGSGYPVAQPSNAATPQILRRLRLDKIRLRFYHDLGIKVRARKERDDGNVGALAALDGAGDPSDRDEQADERSHGGKRQVRAELGARARRLGDRERDHLRLRPSRHPRGSDLRGGRGWLADGERRAAADER